MVSSDDPRAIYHLLFTIYHLRPSLRLRRHLVHDVRSMAGCLEARHDSDDFGSHRLLRLLCARADVMGAIDHRMSLKRAIVGSSAFRWLTFENVESSANLRFVDCFKQGGLVDHFSAARIHEDRS